MNTSTEVSNHSDHRITLLNPVNFVWPKGQTTSDISKMRFARMKTFYEVNEQEGTVMFLRISLLIKICKKNFIENENYNF